MEKPMTIEDVLELVIGYATTQYNPANVGNGDELRRAADILSNMAEEPVDKKSVVSYHKCLKCGHRHAPCGHCPLCGKSSYTSEIMIGKKTWTETRVLKIVEQKIDVKFEEVK